MGSSSPASILPIRNCNDFVASFARGEILSSTKLPVLFGACAFDPQLLLEPFLDRLCRWGFGGVTNFPSVVHLDDNRRNALERLGLGYEREIAMLVAARQRGLATLGYTRSLADARCMAEAGVEALCMNFNLDAGGAAKASAAAFRNEISARTSELVRRVHALDRKIVCLLGGGPITQPDELLDVCRETGAQGFVGGSSFDRVPLETSVLEVTAGFKTVNLLRKRVDDLERQLRFSGYRHGIVAQSAVMKHVLGDAKRLAIGPGPVLVTGEAGTGKRAVASLIHALGSRRSRDAVMFTCREDGKKSRTLDALFGAEIQGEARQRVSILEAASLSSVLLLHVDRLSPDGQERLVDFLETGTFHPIMGSTLRRSNTKLIATATLSLGRLAAEGRFVPRLIEAMSGFEITLPPLRDRLEDLPLLIQHFAVALKGENGSRSAALEKSAFRTLASYDWPGNVRQLRHVVERLSTLAPGTRITSERVEAVLDAPLSTSVRGLSEKEWIIEALRRNKLHRGLAARSLGVSRKTLYNKIKRYKVFD